MSWSTIKQACHRLQVDEPGDEPLTARWAAYRSQVRESLARPPYHLRVLLETLDDLTSRTGLSRENLMILDHGCGGGHTILFLIACGFVRSYGVDLGGADRLARLNEVVAAAGIGEARFFVYDGNRLPFDDVQFDFVFSQQVLEHVSDPFFDAYYSEEARTLKPGGVALHQVPHRLVPYDSHTRTWLIHYLPKFVRPALYRATGNDPAYVERMLHLRWPWLHGRTMRRAFGNYQNITMRRLELTRDFTRPGEAPYDGSVGLRRLIDLGANTPVVRNVLGPIVTKFIMMESLSTKAPARPARHTGPKGQGRSDE